MYLSAIFIIISLDVILKYVPKKLESLYDSVVVIFWTDLRDEIRT